MRKAWGKGKKEAVDRSRQRLYAAGALALAGVVLAAFFTPQLIFRIQDRILYGRTELSQRERMDVEALSGAYEESLYQRMYDFAEGLAVGDSFYVASKSLDPDEGLETFLESDGLVQMLTEAVSAMDMIPMAFWEYGYEASQWKQYVVYSDNYTKGVNFILWYIELASADGMKLKLLVDAQTSTVYALKAQGCGWVKESAYTGEKYLRLFQQENLLELWLLCAFHFGALDVGEDPLDQLLALIGGEAGAAGAAGQEGRPAETDADGAVDLIINYNDDFMRDEYAVLLDYIQSRTEYDPENTQARFRLPYGNASLEALFSIGELDSVTAGFSYIYPDITIGIRQLYELIPEFM